jgi:hypothetical protein
MISNLFKLPRHRTYNYQPRYFDPAKEEREKRLKEKEANSDMEREQNDAIVQKRISIKSNYISNKYAAQKEDKIRRYIRIVTIALLLLVLYMLFDVVVEMY